MNGRDFGLVILGGKVGTNAKGAVGGRATSCAYTMRVAVEDGRREAFLHRPFLESFLEVGKRGEDLAWDELRHRRRSAGGRMVLS